MAVTYEPLATTTLTSASSTITFSSISGSYTDLRVMLVTNGTSVAGNTFVMRYNSDTGTNYSNTGLAGDGSTASSTRDTSTTSIFLYTGSGLDGNTPQFVSVDIFSYAGSTNKTSLVSSNSDLNGSGNVKVYVGSWRSTSAITSVSIVYTGGNFAIGTTASLYGILKA